jgi:hypothetical protein
VNLNNLLDYIKETMNSPIVSKIVFDPKSKYAILYLRIENDSDLGEARKLHYLASHYNLLSSIAISKKIKMIIVRVI